MLQATKLEETTIESHPDLTAIKAKMKAVWEDGDYATFATFMEAGAIEVLDSWNIAPQSRLLDIACGSGQTAIPAAKNGAIVTGVDIAENLIEHARARSHKAQLTARFDIGDAENLPYAEDDFDIAITMFGAMFAPRPEKVVNELARVIRPGGQLIMANWTPQSMPAQMFKAAAEINPPVAGIAPPVLWGNEATVTERLEQHFTDIQLTRRIYPLWDYPFGAAELVDFFARHFGPVKRAFAAADKQQQSLLREKLESIYEENSEIRNEILTITGGEFLQVVATRR